MNEYERAYRELVNIFDLVQALGFADLGETEAGHHGETPLRASGLDESQDSPSQQAAGKVPAAIQ